MEEITTPLSVYNQLMEDQNFLYALQTAGVDNWEGYEFALDTLDESTES